MNLGEKKISIFWNAVIASVVMVASALILDDHSETSKIILFEGILFGVKIGDEFMKQYTIQKSQGSAS